MRVAASTCQIIPILLVALLSGLGLSTAASAVPADRLPDRLAASLRTHLSDLAAVGSRVRRP